MAIDIIKNKLINQLNELFPSFDEFRTRFIKLTYSKKENPTNVKAKYIINKLNCYYSKQELFADDGTVEHILPECDGESSLNIGNLILIEGKLNKEADQLSYKNKIAIYRKSKYPWVADFIGQNKTWSESMIKERAKDMAYVYYTNILKKEIPISKDNEDLK